MDGGCPVRSSSMTSRSCCGDFAQELWVVHFPCATQDVGRCLPGPPAGGRNASGRGIPWSHRIVPCSLPSKPY